MKTKKTNAIRAASGNKIIKGKLKMEAQKNFKCSKTKLDRGKHRRTKKINFNLFDIVKNMQPKDTNSQLKNSSLVKDSCIKGKENAK